ncbi:putative DDE superfamily endonuclease domain-containing protein [Phytophthora infestans]|uniref:Putative DDE superfamily endonuclease domain-containing protein n=1 Tax=Phytophthora infestans TaxID=4787 RepID=A0A833WGV1_PHYIN|nr:putative DDE superfamily endonuclease domain-containing protein [Phytophthora infestans]KAF4149676.1 putative DDE superfamily endonuclease domain-containing protein [Phytophthora infestans]
MMKERGLFSGNRTRALVAECLGCSTDTVARVIAVYNASQKTDFEPALNSRGRPRMLDLNTIAPAIRDVVVKQNMAGQPITVQHVKKRHIYAETPGNVAFRRTYLENKVANRVAVRGPMRGTKRSARLGVDRAEVYLNESYCNVSHVTGNTWLTADKIRYGKTGRGAR